MRSLNRVNIFSARVVRAGMPSRLALAGRYDITAKSAIIRACQLLGLFVALPPHRRLRLTDTQQSFVYWSRVLSKPAARQRRRAALAKLPAGLPSTVPPKPRSSERTPSTGSSRRRRRRIPAPPGSPKAAAPAGARAAFSKFVVPGTEKAKLPPAQGARRGGQRVDGCAARSPPTSRSASCSRARSPRCAASSATAT